MSLTRRSLFRLAGGAAIAIPLGAALGACDDNGGSTGAALTSGLPLPTPFTVPLPIPPLLRPARTEGNVDHYEITQKKAHAEILPGVRTEIWGYNGIFPGPTLSTRSNRQIVVHQQNRLDVPVVVHLHGGKTPPESDGYPTDMIMPPGGWLGAAHPNGAMTTGSRDYTYPLAQPAATLWYHDHRMDFTGPQVYRGLAGFHLIHDAAEDALPLPGGDRDIPLMICDRAFNADGSFQYPALDPTLRDRPGVTADYMDGVLGDVILVNGAPWPTLEVSNTRYRFRLLNAANARRFQLALDPPPPSGRAFTQIGSDAGLLGAPIGHDQITIAQAERFDVIIDFGKYPVGTRITMLNKLATGGAGKVLQFHVVRAAADDSSIPGALVPYETLGRDAASRTRKFDFNQHGDDGWDINGKVFDTGRIDARPKLGDVEIWHFDGDAHHPIHLHLAHFQVLSRNGHSPGEFDHGWKDTVDLESGHEMEVIARFTGYRGRYLLHCHNLEHEDMGMMTNFQVA
jgi:spore coat protein A